MNRVVKVALLIASTALGVVIAEAWIDVLKETRMEPHDA